MTLRRTNTERSRMCSFAQGHSERVKSLDKIRSGLFEG